MKKFLLSLLSSALLLNIVPTCNAMINSNYYYAEVIQCIEYAKLPEESLKNIMTSKHPVEKYEDVMEFLSLLQEGYLDKLDHKTILLFGYNEETKTFETACEFGTLVNLLLG